MRWVALTAVLGIAIAGCGGGGQKEPAAKTPSMQEIAACLQKGGARIGRGLEEEKGTFQMLFAVTPEATFNIANLADAGLASRMITFMKVTKARGGIKGRLITTVVNDGLTVVGVVAAPRTGDPLPSAASEALAKGCAVQPTV